MSTKTFDVAIVGGGPAGLSAATTLARSLRSVVVLDAGQPRNAPAGSTEPARYAPGAHGAHNVLGHEGISPLDLLEKGRAEARGYGAEIRSTEVVDAARNDNGSFAVSLGDGTTITARRLVLASGLVDELPEVPGVQELWGSSVLHCPYCHGYEVRGRRIGVLGTSPMSVHQTLMFRQLSDDVTLFTHTMPEIGADEAEQLSALGVTVVDGPVDHLAITDGALRAVVLGDGSEVERDAVVVAPRFVVRSALFTRLGGVLADHPMGGQYVGTGMMGRTDVPGVWAAGNVADLAATVAVSMGAGVSAGAAVNADLIAEDARSAVEARRVRA
ncbi:NAD(P)/FAD-dependent oxidoreductase [Gordonia insulae]|uniref:Thioredoxin reductase n=1 Tax=Gordonia insulae TaxID=2420509 RepID=A0A3G8JNB0_9ACTN|nr:NAD(P)/FAD-dependent oxidoreductase [Gordonia insulae]AZG46105.1 Thioredoxin reductase [Gordonia insulae]